MEPVATFSMENERDANWRAIRRPPGPARSGRDRYAAAMYFFMAGEMDAETLEIYRICAKLDNEDPVGILRDTGTGAQWVRAISSGRRSSDTTTETR